MEKLRTGSIPGSRRGRASTRPAHRLRSSGDDRDVVDQDKEVDPDQPDQGKEDQAVQGQVIHPDPERLVLRPFLPDEPDRGLDDDHKDDERPDLHDPVEERVIGKGDHEGIFLKKALLEAERGGDNIQGKQHCQDEPEGIPVIAEYPDGGSQFLSAAGLVHAIHVARIYAR